MSEERTEPAELPRTVDWPGSVVLIVTAVRDITGGLEVRISKSIDGGVHREIIWTTSPEETAEIVRTSVGEVIGLRPDDAPDSPPHPGGPSAPPDPPRDSRDPAPQVTPELGSAPPSSASPRPPTS